MGIHLEQAFDSTNEEWCEGVYKHVKRGFINMSNTSRAESLILSSGYDGVWLGGNEHPGSNKYAVERSR